MARIVFKHLVSDDTAVHRFMNFGEDVYRELRLEKRIHVSLEEIDRCTDQFEVRTKPALVRRVLKTVEPILKRHLMTGRCSVTVED
jgi:DNA repair photolyase